MRTVALIGKSGAGKTTIAQMLSEHHGYTKTSIAGPIRDIARMAYGRFDKGMRYPQQTLGLTTFVSGRELLQNIGAALREMDSLFWCRAWWTERISSPEELWVVDDVRLDAERRFIEAWYPGTLFVRLVRPEAGDLENWQLDITERRAGELDAELVLDTEALTPLECLAAVVEAATMEGA